MTATRRSTSVQKTPISITAVTGADLQIRGIANVGALTAEIPGISMKSGGPGQTEYEMRGLSSTGGSSPTVGFYLDDVPMTPPSMGFLGKTVIDPNLYDLNRIEVLRGPQGTLYGSGSMGGTIRLITNQPDSTAYHASVETILSGTDGGGFNHTENAMVNIPVVKDQLAIRAVATESYTSGWIDRIVDNPFPLFTGSGARGNVLAAPVQADYKGVNSEELEGGRISALYTPTSRLTIGTTLFYQHIHLDGESNYDSNPGTLAHYQPFNIAEPYTDSFIMGALNANYRFDNFTVTSVTAYFDRSSSKVQDDSEELYSPQFYNTPSFYVADGGLGAGSILENDKTHQFSQELRVASSGEGRLQWAGGLFYSNLTSTLIYNQNLINALITTPVFGGTTIVGTNNTLEETQPNTISQEAAFGEATYRLIGGLKITAGLRYFEYNSKLSTFETGVLAATNTVISSKDHGITPKLSISDQVNDDLMVYATAERGFRPGGGNQPIPTSGSGTGAQCLADLHALGLSAAPSSYQPDTVWSYELGEKAKIGSAVTLDGAVYHEAWYGVQQNAFLGCGYPFVANFGKAAVDGGEMEANAFLTRNWKITGSFGYAHSAFLENNTATGTVKGQAIQDIAKITASAAVTYFFDLNADWKASVRAAFDYSDGLYEPTIQVPSGQLPAHGFLNLRATMYNDRWTLAAFIDNATNNHAAIGVDPPVALNLAQYSRFVSNQPLTVGIDLNRKF